MNDHSHRKIREFFVRRASPADLAAIAQLARSTPTAAQWSDAAYDSYGTVEGERTSRTTPRMRAIFVACAYDSPASRTETIVGFAAFSALVHGGTVECDLDNIAVREAWRRRGIGRQLLAAGWSWLRDYAQQLPAAQPETQPDSVSEVASPIHPTIWLEVRAGNTDAIAFYQNAGFTTSGRRPAYYSQPVEDAISMQKVL